MTDLYRHKNPWHGQDRPWEEFKWDVQHPDEFFRAVWAGMQGRNPACPPEQRLVAFGMMFVGFISIVLGLLLILGL